MSKRTLALVILVLISITGGTAAFLSQRSPTADALPGCVSLASQNGNQLEHGMQSPSAAMWLKFNGTANVTLDSIDIDAPPSDNPELMNRKDSDIKLVIREFNVPNSQPHELKPGDTAQGIIANQNGPIDGAYGFGAFASLQNVPRPGSYTVNISCDLPVDGETGKKFTTSITLDFFHISLLPVGQGTQITPYGSYADQAAKRAASPDSGSLIISAVEARIDGFTPKNYERLKGYLKDRHLGVFAHTFCNTENMTVSADGAATDQVSSFTGYYDSNSARGFRWSMTPDIFEKDLFEVARDSDDKITSVIPKTKRFTLTKSLPLTARNLEVRVQYTGKGSSYSGSSDVIYLRTTPPDSGVMKVALSDVPKDPIFVGGTEISPINMQYLIQNRIASPTSIKAFVPGVGDVGTFDPSTVSGSSPVVYKDYGKVVGVIPFFVNAQYGYTAPNNGGQINNCQQSQSTARIHTYKLLAKNPLDVNVPAELSSSKTESTKLEIGIDGFAAVKDAQEVSVTTSYKDGITGPNNELFRKVETVPYRQQFIDYFTSKKFTPSIIDKNGTVQPGFAFSASDEDFIASPSFTIDGSDFIQELFIRNLSGTVVDQPRLRLAIDDTSAIQEFILNMESVEDFSIEVKSPEGIKDTLDLNPDFERQEGS